MEEIISNKYSIFTRGIISGDFPSVIMNVYAPNNYMNRRVVWNEIKELKKRYILPWCLGGDFNEIKSVGERIGCTRINRGMRDF